MATQSIDVPRIFKYRNCILGDILDFHRPIISPSPHKPIVGRYQLERVTRLELAHRDELRDNTKRDLVYLKNLATS